MTSPHTKPTVNRRTMLKAGSWSVGATLLGSQLPTLSAQNSASWRPPTNVPKSQLHRIDEHVFVYNGTCNVGILVGNAHDASLIDIGDGAVLERLQDLNLHSIAAIYVTHHHRDSVCGLLRLQNSCPVYVPAKERDYFEKPSAYWTARTSRWNIVSQHPHHILLTEPVAVAGTLQGGDTFRVGQLRITVLDTPGHTDGAVSYIVDTPERRICFCGDLICSDGQLWDAYSLQKGYQRNGRRISDYHGFLGAQWQLRESLKRIVAAKPDVLVPAHGPIIENPSKAVSQLLERLDRFYDNYVSISALRYYFPELFLEWRNRPHHMQPAHTEEPPPILRHVGTSWILLSQTGAAFVMDCGSPRVVKTLQEWIAAGEVRSIEGLWITHYHHDHVQAVPEFQKAFSCPCWTDRHVAAVVSNPMAWRLPCISPSVVRVDHPTEHGQSWQWHEYRMTAFHFPGQTLYHAGLLVENGNYRMFFVGDSFTPTGIDDYCAQNRVWLGENRGFDFCIRLLKQLKPTHLFNCHVNVAFKFSAEQYDKMQKTLAGRYKLALELFPWEEPNYALDEYWVRPYPYEQTAKVGSRARVSLVVTNHSQQPRTAWCRINVPSDWQAAAPAPLSLANLDRLPHRQVNAHQEAAIELEFAIPTTAKPGRYVLPIDVIYDKLPLPQICECIVQVQ